MFCAPLTRVCVSRGQCDQIGRVFTIFGNKLSHPSSPNILLPFGLFLKMSLLRKKYVATFGQFLEEICQLFIPSSGHTGRGVQTHTLTQRILLSRNACAAGLFFHFAQNSMHLIAQTDTQTDRQKERPIGDLE